MAGGISNGPASSGLPSSGPAGGSGPSVTLDTISVAADPGGALPGDGSYGDPIAGFHQINQRFADGQRAFSEATANRSNEINAQFQAQIEARNAQFQAWADADIARMNAQRAAMVAALVATAAYAVEFVAFVRLDLLQGLTPDPVVRFWLIAVVLIPVVEETMRAFAVRGLEGRESAGTRSRTALVLGLALGVFECAFKTLGTLQSPGPAKSWAVLGGLSSLAVQAMLSVAYFSHARRPLLRNIALHAAHNAGVGLAAAAVAALLPQPAAFNLAMLGLVCAADGILLRIFLARMARRETPRSEPPSVEPTPHPRQGLPPRAEQQQDEQYAEAEAGERGGPAGHGVAGSRRQQPAPERS